MAASASASASISFVMFVVIFMLFVMFGSSFVFVFLAGLFNLLLLY